MTQPIATLLFISLVLLAGCVSGTSHNLPEKQQGVIGEYSGNLPCADCEKIDYQLNLKPDMTYQESLTYSGKSVQPFNARGPYTINPQGLVTLGKEDQNGMRYFKPHPEGMLLLDREGNEITGKMANLYVLRKSPHDESSANQRNPIRTRKREQGIDFYGRGNEPFWSIDMDFDKSFTFTEMNATPIHVPAVKGTSTPNHYQATTEKADLSVSLIEQSCQDSMSGELFSHKVEVTLKLSGSQDSHSFKGCGEFLTDTRLYGTWQFSAINESPLLAEAYMKGLPTITLSAENNRLSGHDGCNRLMGGFSIQKNTISFKQLASTMMACPEKKGAVNINPIIANQTFDYLIENDNLYLIKEGKTIITLTPATSSE
ncbi:MAG: copper resistance protein NlpE N-terminal domain-containing protein [Methylomicrobium sp.]|nr:copper resistance protein NlpE N-terminal domain-containing protein [Methylomicrobium sp.]